MTLAGDGRNWRSVRAESPTVHTIADHAAREYKITAYCEPMAPAPRCGVAVRIDLHTLAAVFGPAFPISHATLAPRLQCPKCGGPISIRVAPP